MPDAITLTLDSNAAKIATQLRAFPAAMQRGVCAALDQENQVSIGLIMQKLSGPVLHVRTNRLRGSIHAARARVAGDTIVSAIGSNVKYAGVHEYGFDGMVTVPQHTRRQFTAYQAQISATFNTETGKIEKAKKRARRVETGAITVKAFQMHMRMPERSYIRSTLRQGADYYRAAVSKAIVAAWQTPGTS